MGFNCTRLFISNVDQWEWRKVPNLCPDCIQKFLFDVDNIQLIYPDKKRSDIEKEEAKSIGELFEKNKTDWINKTEKKLELEIYLNKDKHD